MKKILFCTGEGIGNVIQTIPVVRTLKENFNTEIDYWHAFGSFQIPKIIPYVDKWFSGPEIRKINVNDYEFMVSTFWTRNHIDGLKKVIPLEGNVHPLKMHVSEIETYLKIARDLGIEEEKLIWTGYCNYNIGRKEEFDLVIANGYNRSGSANWKIKSYPYYEKVVKLLSQEDLSIASIGAPNEYVEGTIDRTRLSLLESCGVIKQSRLVLSNDSGAYHISNALEVPNVVIFTATSIEKNYDARFHTYSELLFREDLECRPCQKGRGWKTCSHWNCRKIDPKRVVELVLKKLF
jgi:ADP-heptose:LPS heptosyltransferase